MSRQVNVFFCLLLTLSPYFLCADPLMMIEKIPESQNIMNAIHLQIKLKGKDLEKGDIVKILETARHNADHFEAQQKASLEASHKACTADLKQFQAAVYENIKWEFVVGRQVSNNQRAVKQIQQFIDRVSEEKSGYSDLTNIIKASWEKWQHFHNTSIAGIEQVQGYLRKARSELRRLGNKNASFVEIGENSQFATNLNEIRVGFENTFVDLQGFRPVITKLLQLMTNGNAVSKDVVRTKLIALFRKIRGELQNIRDEIEATASRQSAIFSAILEGYKENTARVAKLLDRLTKEKKDLSEDSKELNESQKQSQSITHEAQNIFKTRKNQCIVHVEEITKISVQVQSIRSVIAHLAEILEEKFGKIKTYFLQREMKLT